jgi:hypothetical protein
LLWGTATCECEASWNEELEIGAGELEVSCGDFDERKGGADVSRASTTCDDHGEQQRNETYEIAVFKTRTRWAAKVAVHRPNLT